MPVEHDNQVVRIFDIHQDRRFTFNLNTIKLVGLKIKSRTLLFIYAKIDDSDSERTVLPYLVMCALDSDKNIVTFLEIEGDVYLEETVFRNATVQAEDLLVNGEVYELSRILTNNTSALEITAYEQGGTVTINTNWILGVGLGTREVAFDFESSEAKTFFEIEEDY